MLILKYCTLDIDLSDDHHLDGIACTTVFIMIRPTRWDVNGGKERKYSTAKLYDRRDPHMALVVHTYSRTLIPSDHSSSP